MKPASGSEALISLSLSSSSSGRSQESDPHGPQWFIRPLRQTQNHPRPQKRDQTEDQDHPLVSQPLLERVLHLVSQPFPVLLLSFLLSSDCSCDLCFHLQQAEAIRQGPPSVRGGVGLGPYHQERLHGLHVVRRVGADQSASLWMVRDRPCVHPDPPHPANSRTRHLHLFIKCSGLMNPPQHTTMF